MFGVGKTKVSYKEAAQWLCALALDNVTNPPPSLQEMLRLAEQNGFDREDFAEEWLWLSMFVIGASIRTARDRRAIKTNDFAILFPAYIEELQHRFVRLESESEDERYKDAGQCAEMLSERSAAYGKGMELAQGDATKSLVLVGMQFAFFVSGDENNEFCRGMGMSSYFGGNAVIERLSKMKFYA